MRDGDKVELISDPRIRGRVVAVSEEAEVALVWLMGSKDPVTMGVTELRVLPEDPSAPRGLRALVRSTDKLLRSLERLQKSRGR